MAKPASAQPPAKNKRNRHLMGIGFIIAATPAEQNHRRNSVRQALPIRPDPNPPGRSRVLPAARTRSPSLPPFLDVSIPAPRNEGNFDQDLTFALGPPLAPCPTRSSTRPPHRRVYRRPPDGSST